MTREAPTPFVNKSVSEETRRAYGRALREFFQFAGMKHPVEEVTNDVVLWRDRLRSQKKSAATVAFKLSVVRSFFEYLKAAGGVPLNPASTKLVSPPELPSESAGRALSAKEVRYLLSGPDREKPEGARDYELMLVMLRLSLRVSEVCSLRSSAHELPDARLRQGALDQDGAEDRQAVGRLLEDRRSLAARPAEDGHHKGLRIGPHLQAGADDAKHKDPKTVMRYDHGRENMEQNAVNFLGYDEE